MKIKVGIIQFDVKLGNVKANIETVINGIKYLGSKNANMALLPEMWSCAFDNEKLLIHAKKTPNIIKMLSEEAIKYNMLIVGSLPEYVDENIFNTMYLIDSNGKIAGFYRKIHLFSPTKENNYFCRGNKSVVCKTSLGIIGLMICYDLRFPELCRVLTLSGATMVVISAQWPLVRIKHWDILARARAIENQIFIAAANRCGKDNGIEYGGNSQLISPKGNVLAKVGNEACVLCEELDFDELSDFRNKIPCLKDRAPDTYK